MPIAKYRKKPVVIEAIQFLGEENLNELHAFTGHFNHHGEPADVFQMLEEPEDDIVAEVWDKLHSTWVGVKKGQYIIKGVQGEFYPCDEDVFKRTYDPAGW